MTTLLPPQRPPPPRWPFHYPLHSGRTLTRAHGAALVQCLHRAGTAGRRAHHGVTDHRASLQREVGGGGWGLDWDPCPRTQTSVRPSAASYLAGAQRAERVIVRRPASPMGALLPLEVAGVGVSRSPRAAGFGWRGGVRAEHSGQRRQGGGRCIRSPGRPRSLSPRRRQPQAAHLALVGDVHLGGEAG